METLELRDGYRIQYSFEKVQNAEALVIITHGFAEHMGRYDYFSESLKKKGFSVLRYDLRGHGANDDRGYLRDFDDYVYDLKELTTYVKQKAEGAPVFLLGHSMGGLITALYSSRYTDGVRAVILSGPSTGRLPSAMGYNKGVMKALKTLAGRVTLNNPINEGICSDPQVFRDYASDQMVLHKATLSLYYEFLFHGTDSLNDYVEEFSLPCLICHGEMDPIVPKELSKSFFEKIASEDKELRIYEGLFHEILNEKIRDQVIYDMVDWIKSRI